MNKNDYKKEADDGDREAAKTAVCPKCGKVGMRYVVNKDGDVGYRCDICHTTDWI